MSGPARTDAPTWTIAVHGGAKLITLEQEAANAAGCRAALAAGQSVLMDKGSAIEAVEAAIRVLEDDPTFNAGHGSVRNAAGTVEMDAALMEGQTFNIGAVAALSGVRHPISVARQLLYEREILLCGSGARAFAMAVGAEHEEVALQSVTSNDASHDTVGCVALDEAGHVAAGTSTGGLDGVRSGRIGDSPLPGCGFYADDEIGAVVFSGDGENIARALLAGKVMQALSVGEGPTKALDEALVLLDRIGGEAGGIAIDRQGRVGLAHSSADFVVAWINSRMDAAEVRLRRNEER
jgi:L-asparaginase / beta-aspartyl-peptidase